MGLLKKLGKSLGKIAKGAAKFTVALAKPLTKVVSGLNIPIVSTAAGIANKIVDSPIVNKAVGLTAKLTSPSKPVAAPAAVAPAAAAVSGTVSVGTTENKNMLWAWLGGAVALVVALFLIFKRK